MPSQPAHGASFRGLPVDFDVQAHVGRRFRVASHMNAYVGALRRQVPLVECVTISGPTATACPDRVPAMKVSVPQPDGRSAL